MSLHQHGYPWLFFVTLLYRPLLPAGLQAKFRIGTELLYVRSIGSSCLCSSMWRGPPEYIIYVIILTSPVVFRISGSSNFDSFLMGGKRLYSCWFVGCCLHDLFNNARSILVWLPSSFFSTSLVCTHVVHSYSSIDTTAVWKKLRFILSVRCDFHMTDSLSIAAHTFASHVLMSFSVDETLLPT